MSHRIEAGNAEYAWSGGCAMRMETQGESFLPPEVSLSQFITEHYWGYASQKGGGCLEYEVQHPPWMVWNAKAASFSGDVEALYGTEFAQVLKRKPDSAFLAKGSAVTVFKGTRVV